MSLLIRLAAATLPLAIRDRYREQWTADLRDAAEGGVSRSSIVLGSLVFAATLNRSGVDVYPAGELARARVLRGVAFTLSGLVAAFGALVNGQFGDPIVPGDAVGHVVRLAIVIVVTIGGLGGGLVLLAAGVLVPGRRSALALGALATLIVGYASVALVPAVGWLAVLAPVVLVPGGLGTLLLWAVLTPRSGYVVGRRPSSMRATASALVFGVAIMIAVLVVGVLDGLVWMPLALAPGYSLGDIYVALGTDLRGSIASIIVWLVLWLGATVTAAVVLRRVGRTTVVSAGVVLLVFAGLVSAAIFFEWFATFAMGNSVSDALPPYRGGLSTGAMWLYFVGQLLLAGVAVGAISPRARPALITAQNA